MGRATNANADANGLATRGSARLLPFAELPSLCNDSAHVPFDLAISNPPWLPEKVMKHARFARDVVSQPLAAFASGYDGLQAYSELSVAFSAPGVLAPKAWVVLGCQEGHAARVSSVFEATGKFEVVAENDRSLVLR